MIKWIKVKKNDYGVNRLIEIAPSGQTSEQSPQPSQLLFTDATSLSSFIAS